MAQELIVGRRYYCCGVAGGIPNVRTYIFRGHQRLQNDTALRDNPTLYYVFELTDGRERGTNIFCNIPHSEQAKRRMLDWVEFLDVVNDVFDDE